MYVTINGLGMHVDIRGEGEPVLLLHGLTGGVRAWSRQIPALSRTFRTIAVDSRGIGRSEPVTVPYTVEDLADDVLGLMDHLALPRATIMGLSMGGGVAQTLALRYPDRVSALVLVATSSTYPDHVRQRFVEEALIAEERGMAELADRLTDRWLSADAQRSDPELTEATRQELVEMDPHIFAIRCRANSTRNLTARLPEIGCPVLFVGGSEERESVAAAHEYEQALPDCRVRIITGATHFVQQEAAAEFNEIVTEFISGKR